MASRPEQLPTAAGLTLSNEEDERTDSSDASTDIEREQSICHLKNVDSLFRLRRSAGFAFPRSALHAVGLKFSTPKYPYRTPQGKERPKVLINTLRRIAVARATVHLLPTIISTLIIAGNAVPLVNGPDITIEAKFFLQAASKFHVRLSNPYCLPFTNESSGARHNGYV